MEYIVVAVLLGALVGAFCTAVPLWILTAVYGLLLGTAPRDTLAAVLYLVILIPGGAFIVSAWVSYLITTGRVKLEWFKSFVRNR